MQTLDADSLRKCLTSLPDALVNTCPAGLAFSSSAWVKRDGDRCGAYLVLQDGILYVEDDGAFVGTLDNVQAEAATHIIQEAGAAVEDFTIRVAVSSPEATPAAAAHMLALLWRLHREVICVDAAELLRRFARANNEGLKQADTVASEINQMFEDWDERLAAVHQRLDSIIEKTKP